MKISFEVPNGFVACGITMVYEDDRGYNMYSTTVTFDEIAHEKVVTLPKMEVQKNANNA